MVLLGEQIRTELEPEMGSFLYQMSEEFWAEHSDLFGEDGHQPGVVLQFGEDLSGNIVLHDDKARNMKIKPRTLIFKADEDGTFSWKYIEVDETGRTESLLNVQGSAIAAMTTRFDIQGRQGPIEDLDVESRHNLQESVLQVISSEAFMSQSEAIRDMRIRAQKEIARFALEGKLEFAPQKFEKLLDEKKKVLKKFYLPSLGVTL